MYILCNDLFLGGGGAIWYKKEKWRKKCQFDITGGYFLISKNK